MFAGDEWILARYLAKEARREVATIPAARAGDDEPQDPLDVASEAEAHVDKLVSNGQLEEASVDLLSIIKLQPTNHFLAGPILHLAEMCAKQGKLSEAESLGLALLELRKEFLGNDHPETLKARFSVASLLARQQRLTEADAMMEGVPPYERGEVYGRAGCWKGAVLSLRQGIESEPDNFRPYFRLAPTLMLIGDVEGYRQLCQRIVVRFTGVQNAAQADTLAKACLLLPSSGVDLKITAAWTETAVTLGNKSEAFPWVALSKSLAEYRQEHFAEAADWGEKSLAAAGKLLQRDAPAYFVLAMAQMKSKQTAAARTAFDKGVEIVEKKLAETRQRRSRCRVD